MNFAEQDAGTYTAVVSNVANSVTSAEAVVTYQAAVKIVANGKSVYGIVRTLVRQFRLVLVLHSGWIGA